jgi:hypothetical protein
MEYPENKHFQHRQNEDRTVDSICPHCYLTVASAQEEQHLLFPERLHECVILRLDQFANTPRPLHVSPAA